MLAVIGVILVGVSGYYGFTLIGWPAFAVTSAIWYVIVGLGIRSIHG
jgi:hypothetical protein